MMSFINKEAFEYNMQMAPIIKQISQPLRNHLGIHHFCYAKFYNNGDIFRLGDHAGWTKQFFQHEFYNDAQIFTTQIKDVPLHHSSHFLITGKPKGKHLTLLHEYNLWHIFHIYMKNDCATELFVFATNKENEEIVNFYLNKASLLKQFIIHFKTQYRDILKHNQNNLIHSHLRMEETLTSSEEDKLKNWNIDKFYLDDQSYLTKRELECAQELIKGHTIKEIARALKASPRTIEIHVNNIKLKTGSHFKSQLVKTLINSGLGEV